MLTFLFWNIKGVKDSRPLASADERHKRLKALLAEAVPQENVDVLIIAESPFRGALSLAGMKRARTEPQTNAKTGCELEIYYRTARLAMRPIEDIGRATIQKIIPILLSDPILLIAAHLSSPQFAENEEQRKEKVGKLASKIAGVEQRESNDRTLLVGDLNYSLYDAPIWDARYLHAVPTQTLARQEKRIVDSEIYRFFYNPMWAHFSHRENASVGETYYRRSSTVNCRFWHIPDQVLLRPALLPYWKDENLSVLTKIGEHLLIKENGEPHAAQISDHLPLLFRLDV